MYGNVENISMMMTPQEIFDTVANHLRKQGRPAMSEGNCVYRGPDGTKCAIGCLIPDELYEEDMEGRGVLALITPDEYETKFVLPDFFNDENVRLMMDLQTVHDSWARYQTGLEDGLRSVAKHYELEYRT